MLQRAPAVAARFAVRSPTRARVSKVRREAKAAVPIEKWGLALLPAPTAPSEGYAGVRNLVTLPEGSRTRFRSWLTSSGVASHPTAPSEGGALTGSPNRATRGLACPSNRPGLPRTEILDQNRSTFCGPSWVDHSCVPLRSRPRKALNRVALEEDRLFRRLFPAGPPSRSRKSLCIACRQRSDLWSPAAPRAVAGS